MINKSSCIWTSIHDVSTFPIPALSLLTCCCKYHPHQELSCMDLIFPMLPNSLIMLPYPCFHWRKGQFDWVIIWWIRGEKDIVHAAVAILLARSNSLKVHTIQEYTPISLDPCGFCNYQEWSLNFLGAYLGHTDSCAGGDSWWMYWKYPCWRIPSQFHNEILHHQGTMQEGLSTCQCEDQLKAGGLM